MFEKVLIAARGEIALRIHRACHEMGIKTVAVHSTVDANAMHVKLADESVCIGPAPARDSYLNKASILSAAIMTGVDAIHPGYGFLSENDEFAEMVQAHGMTFIGPEPQMIRLMGDKLSAREAAKKAGLPVIEGSESELKTPYDAVYWADRIGYPVIIKATCGGGGKGMKVAYNATEVAEAFNLAQKEAKSAFGNASVYVEKYLQNPRHIEVQIMADHYGNVIHLGERDCSIQRQNQKILEETPSPALNAEQRQNLCDLVVRAVKTIGYTNVGTVEFLYENGQFYFLEMNTRVQVEHPITEAVTGVDIVRDQIRISSGAMLGYQQEDIHFNGYAMECRINAENSDTFIPNPGRIDQWHTPGGLDVRVDSEMYAGYTVPSDYDSLIAKLVVHGRTRNGLLMRLKRSLEEFVIEGIQTTIPLHQKIITHPEFIDGQYHIHWLEQMIKK